MLAAFSDEALIQKAQRSHDWTATDYQNAVNNMAFPPKPGSGGAKVQGWVSPMGTDRYTCITTPASCDVCMQQRGDGTCLETLGDQYVKNGESWIDCEAEAAHERVHSESCREMKKARGNDLAYANEMGDPKGLSNDEKKAYSAEIKFLDEWLAANCQ